MTEEDQAEAAKRVRDSMGPLSERIREHGKVAIYELGDIEYYTLTDAELADVAALEAALAAAIARAAAMHRRAQRAEAAPQDKIAWLEAGGGERAAEKRPDPRKRAVA
jgi:hypothetical protein